MRPALRLSSLPLGTILGVVLLLGAFGLLAGALRAAYHFDAGPELIDFYPPEQNAQIDYQFAHPSANLFWREPPPADAVLSLRIMSPAPLPRRDLRILHLEQEVARVSVGEQARTIHMLLPPGPIGAHGYALDLRADGASAPGDPRALGLLFDEIDLAASPPHVSLLPYAGAGALLLIVSGVAAWIGLGWIISGGMALALALIFRANTVYFWGYAGGLTLVLGLARAVLSSTAFSKPVTGLDEGRRTKDESKPRLPLSSFVFRLSSPSLRARRLSTPAWVALLIGAGYVVWIGGYALRSHALYNTNAYDLGLYDQTLYLISRLLPNFSTGSGINQIGSHAAVVLYPMAALYWLLPDVRLLLLVQVAAVALAMAPLYLLGRDRGYPWIGVAAGVAYLLHPATQNMALFDFHADTIGATGLIFALWAADRRRWRLMLACCILVMACKENLAITTAWLGLWLIVRGERRVGALVLVGSAAWFLFATQVFVPGLIGQSESLHVARFRQYGATVPEILLTVITRPWLVLRDLVPYGADAYLLGLLIPFAFLSLFSPYILLTLPALAINLLSNVEAQRTLEVHYSALIVAILAVSALHAASWISAVVSARVGQPGTALREPVGSSGRRTTDDGRHGIVGIGLAILLIVAGYLGQSVAPLRRDAIDDKLAREESLAYQRDYLLSLVPPEAAVSAPGALQPHLTHRQQAFLYPNPFIQANFYNPAGIPFVPEVEYLIVDTRRNEASPVSFEQRLQLLKDLQARGLYRRRASLSGIVLLERSPAQLPATCFGGGWNDPLCQTGARAFTKL